MKIKKVRMITEAARNVEGAEFLNSTEDQFPYIDAAINSMDNNYKWWKEHWADLEQMVAQYLDKAMKDSFEIKKVKVSSRFTMFHGNDQKAKDVVWTGPAIVYTFMGASTGIVSAIKTQFGGIYEGHKIFTDKDQLII